MIICLNCEQPFEPERSRWLCPTCKAKNACCEGEPQKCIDASVRGTVSEPEVGHGVAGLG